MYSAHAQWYAWYPLAKADIPNVPAQRTVRTRARSRSRCAALGRRSAHDLASFRVGVDRVEPAFRLASKIAVPLERFHNRCRSEEERRVGKEGRSPGGPHD